MNVFENNSVHQLVDAFLMLETREECEKFLEDLLTTKEILDAAQRLAVAKMLEKHAVYNEISNETGASSATISRVNRACLYGPGGYRTVLERLEKRDSEEK